MPSRKIEIKPLLMMCSSYCSLYSKQFIRSVFFFTLKAFWHSFVSHYRRAQIFQKLQKTCQIVAGISPKLAVMVMVISVSFGENHATI